MLSLKTRLRISIVAPVLIAAAVLLSLHVRASVENEFNKHIDIAKGVASEVGGFLLERVSEQSALVKPQPRRVADTERLWMDIVRTDGAVAMLLRHALTTHREIIEVLVTGEDGEILASSNSSSVGTSAREYPDTASWRSQSLLKKVQDMLAEPRNYETRVPLGVVGRQAPLFTVRVVVSAVLLGDKMEPELRALALVSIGALAGSLLLSVLVSNLALVSLDRIGQTIDRIASGEMDRALPAPAHQTPELAVVQSKLNLLGEQYRGARKDALQLRSGIEQLLEKLEGAVLLFDQNGQLIVAGRAAERILGTSRRDLTGRRLDEVIPAAAPVADVLKTAIDLGRPVRDFSFSLERDGSPAAPLLLSCEILENFSTGQRLGTLIMLRDAEPRRQLESRLEVASRLTAISRLTGGVAHEIKNPLNAIALHLEVLKSKLGGDAEGQTEIAVISREIFRLDRVVKTFLDFNRPVDLQLRVVDVAALIEEIRSLVAVEAERRQIRIDLDVDPSSGSVRADRDLLKQAVLNVVVNGLEAMPLGGTLSIRAARHADEQILSVSDQGNGIPEEVREKVFNLYFSTKQRGSGIGLAMAFRVVQLHGGTIEFTSETGKGTTFWFRFPAYENSRDSVAEGAVGTG
jgi:PAS domain S-box-containing protein